MMAYVFMAALPAAAVAFLITVELPIEIKAWIYKVPTFLLSTIVNVVVLTPLYGLMVGGLAVFVGEFVLWPVLAIDSKIIKEKVRLLKATGNWPPRKLTKKQIAKIVKTARRQERKAARQNNKRKEELVWR